MADQTSFSGTVRDIGFPMVIALTALVLALSSAIVNYRQNSLALLESGMRDTRDQLQLAKNDIADMKSRTLQQLVEAELAIRNRDKILDEKDELMIKLADANTRIKELEAQVRELDQSLEKKKREIESSKKQRPAKAAAKPKAVKSRPVVKPKPAAKPEKPVASEENAATAQSAAVKPESAPAAKASSSTIEKRPPAPSKEKKSAPVVEATPANADLDIYTKNIADVLQNSIGELAAKDGFKAKFPEPRADMKMTDKTTVFYYNDRYKPVAGKLVKALSDMTEGQVILRRGASPFAENKIIVHVIAD